MRSLNQAYTRLGMKRRYESWFLRFGLSDGSGACWLRYLLFNPGRSGCSAVISGAPAQVWATWFPSDGKPETYIREFGLDDLNLHRRKSPFRLEIGPNWIEEDRCQGSIQAQGQNISWDLLYRSTFGTQFSHKGWIGFSRTPHSDAIFDGEIRMGDRIFAGSPLGIGVQGHNCGSRHRKFWTWTHVCFSQPDGTISSFEALVYEMPLGLVFRKAMVYHKGELLVLRKLSESRRDRSALRWSFQAVSSKGTLDVEIDGGGPSLHRIHYLKTDCSGTFEVANNSRARAELRLKLHNRSDATTLTTTDGAVLEIAGDY